MSPPLRSERKPNARGPRKLLRMLRRRTYMRTQSLTQRRVEAAVKTSGPNADAQPLVPASLQAFLKCLGLASLFLVLLLAYYVHAWGGAYCEADVAQWALVFGWTGVATALYNYLVELWFWRQWRWAAPCGQQGR